MSPLCSKQSQCGTSQYIKQFDKTLVMSDFIKCYASNKLGTGTNTALLRSLVAVS